MIAETRRVWSCKVYAHKHSALDIGVDCAVCPDEETI